MSRQQVCQKYIFKIHTSRLRKAHWDLTLPLAEARKNDEVISLADSQQLRWLDELNGVEDAEGRARDIKAEIRRLRKEACDVQTKRQIRRLYDQLDEVQFKPDYMCLVIDKDKDYYRACEGFKINGLTYHRLLGTNGGVKTKTIVFLCDRHAEEIKRRVENGRDRSQPLVPAKLEAYKALTCSASTPVTQPRGVLVVNDCETEFLSDVVYLDDECEGEPLMEMREKHPVKLDESDGYGLIHPSLAEQWGADMGVNYLPSGMCTRYAWCKGMVFTFDFVDFAEKVAGTYMVKDAWGNEVDVRDVDLVLTTSMVKLWDSYDSCESYMKNSMENKYTFGVTKVSPRSLESERTTNYQFIQSMALSDEDMEALIKPTMDDIRGVLYADWAKTVLYLKGMGLNARNIWKQENDYAKALMIDPDMIKDPYVRTSIYQMIRNRINEAKVGVLKVHGNYSIVSGDPYALCQSIFGLPVTGLLAAGEVYNRYWEDHGSDKLACFRAPMTAMENIRIVRVHRSDAADYWYRYIGVCTLFNAWDTAACALNGLDKDGDIVMLTDNDVILRNVEERPALMCVQRKASKKIVTEEDSIASNVASFGDDIGKITNRITTMFDIQAQYESGSPEYEVLAYRIRSGQLFQQNAIDKAKGIIAKPMPKTWYDKHSVNKMTDPEERELYLRILADKKPYFMRYIYSDLMRDYRVFTTNTNKNCLREFGITMDELLNLPEDELTEKQSEFLRFYHIKMPVNNNGGLMNRICKRFEQEFDGFLTRKNREVEFDHSMLKGEHEYTQDQVIAIQKLYNDYGRRMRDFVAYVKPNIDEYEAFSKTELIRYEFERLCACVCPDRATLCDILLDVCYRSNQSKRFAWDMCGDEIIRNLLKHNGNAIKFPTVDESGEIEYHGERFSIQEIKMEDMQ